MEFVGIIVAVSNLEEKQGSTQPNNQASIQCYRDIVVQTQEGFPKGICATLKGDAARDFKAPKFASSSSPASTNRKPRANGSHPATLGVSVKGERQRLYNKAS